MEKFIADRLANKIEALAKDSKVPDADKPAKSSALEKEYQFENWVADAAESASQIHFATHILKAVHPDARGSNIVVETETTTSSREGLVSSAVLKQSIRLDVVGNAAAQYVAKFVKLDFGAKSFLDLAIEKDPDLMSALSSEVALSSRWLVAFAAIGHTKGVLSSHALAKQIYFPMGDGKYHLLSPLFPTSLVQRFYDRLQDDRYSEGAKAARDAKKKNEPHIRGYCDYPDLGLQKLGGTKPLNISTLNHERRGANWLLSSVPPSWHSAEIVPPFNAESVFDGPFGRKREVRAATNALRKFLEETDNNNITIRLRRAALVGVIVDQLIDFMSRLTELTPGWSADARCFLSLDESFWLDPYRAKDDEEFRNARRSSDWQQTVGGRFAKWLNRELSIGKMDMGDDEHAQWSADLEKELRMFRDNLESIDE